MHIRKSLLKASSCVLALLAVILPANSFALTAGADYTVSINKINSSGQITTLGLATTATADSTGKITFSLSGVPDNSSCNFLVVSVLDSTGATVRRSVVPCPDPGGTLPLGVSGLTDKQSDALINAFSTVGTDDPILAIFGMAIVRSTGITSAEVTLMATFAVQGITGANGFVPYLTANGVTTAQLAAYRTAIVSQLADPNTGYSKLFKDSVDASTAATELEKRGEAAALLLNILVKAATTAGFPQDRVLEAFNAMGAIVVPLMNSAVSSGTISQSASKMIDSSIGGGMQKLKAEKNIEKYSAALTTLGATGSDVTSYQTAANTLMTAMISAFKSFEQVYDGNETSTEIQGARTTLDSAMQTAFTAFMTSTAASDARITAMISNINTALNVSTGLAVSNFKFYTSGGSAVNWPITMVIPTDWVSSVVSAGGSVSYTRDTTAIPSTVTWMGTCSNNAYYDRNSCQANGATWTTARTDFAARGINSNYAALFGIQEDVMILEFTRWASQSTAGDDMGQQSALEKSFADKMAALAGNVSGTTNGTTAISATQKSALVTLMQSPQF